MELKELQKRCYEQAIQKGWGSTLGEIPIPEQIAHIHAEVSEAFESYRNGEEILWEGIGGKPEGIGAEYADVIVRICHYAEILNIDLDGVIAMKLAYNLTRPHRHGGKKT